MPKLRTALIAGGAAILFAGAAFAAAEKFHTMKVDLPDGSVAHITYVGDTAPKVAVEPADSRAPVAYDPFAEMDRRMAAMQQQVAAMQAAAAKGQGVQVASGQPGQMMISGSIPAGSSYSYTMVTSSNGKNACTQTVEYRSDGKSPEPKVTHASSGDCEAVKMRDTPVPASAPAKEAPKFDPRSI